MKRAIVPIVEGYGEVTAVPLLLRKILHEHHQQYDIRVEPAIRGHRGQLSKCGSLARWTAIARGLPNCSGIVVIIDEDDDCAKVLGRELKECAEARANGVPVYVVIASREYESWLLASIDSIKGHGGLVPDPVLPTQGPESVRDAKGWVQRNMGRGLTYSETVDQEKLTAYLDLRVAYANSRSFKKLLDDMSDLVIRLGRNPVPL